MLIKQKPPRMRSSYARRAPRHRRLTCPVACCMPMSIHAGQFMLSYPRVVCSRKQPIDVDPIDEAIDLVRSTPSEDSELVMWYWPNQPIIVGSGFTEAKELQNTPEI